MVRPRNNYIVVKPTKKIDKIGSFLISEETAERETPTKGEIIAVAPNSEKSHNLEVGQIVYYKKFAGAPINMGSIKDEDYWVVVPEEDVIAVEEPDDGK